MIPSQGHRGAGVVTALVWVLCAGVGGAADWPQWRGPGRDGLSPETGLLPRWPAAGPPCRWTATGLGRGWSSPVVVGERLYLAGDVGDDLVVFALDTRGRLRWRAVNGRAWKGPYPGARAACAVAAGRVLHLNAHGRVACLDADTGRERWHVNILERFGGRNITWALSECLLVDGDRVIVTPGGERALMAALDLRDGHTIWVTPGRAGEATSHCSPIGFTQGGRRVIANASSRHGFGVDADTGVRLWTVPLRNRFGTNVATPVQRDGRIFFVTPYGELGRQYRLLADGGVSAVPVWTCPADAVTGGALLLGETLFAAGYRADRWWRGYDWRTGRVRYEQRDLTTGAAIAAEGCLYVLDQTGTVALLRPEPETLVVAGRFQLTPEPVRDAWAHPVLSAGCLYLRYHETLWCYAINRPVGGPSPGRLP